MNGDLPFSYGVRPSKPLNLDPDALAVLARMRAVWRRWEDADTLEAQTVIIAEAREMVPAYNDACRTIGISAA